MAEPSFVELIERLQNNDREAIELLIERYGRALRRAIDRGLFEQRLAWGQRSSAKTETSDIYQTVLLLFLARLERGKSADGPGAGLAFESPGHLVAYLKTIAGNEIKRCRRGAPMAAKIGKRSGSTNAGSREDSNTSSLAKVAVSNEPTPIQNLIKGELMARDEFALAEVEHRLHPKERAIWDLVNQGLSWPEIADRLGGSADALRKIFSRAIRRIAGELGARGELTND